MKTVQISGSRRSKKNYILTHYWLTVVGTLFRQLWWIHSRGDPRFYIPIYPQSDDPKTDTGFVWGLLVVVVVVRV